MEVWGLSPQVTENLPILVTLFWSIGCVTSIKCWQVRGMSMCLRGIHLYLQSWSLRTHVDSRSVFEQGLWCKYSWILLTFSTTCLLLFQSGLQHRRKREDVTLLRTLTCCLSAAFAQLLSESVSVGGETRCMWTLHETNVLYSRDPEGSPCLLLIM